MSDDAYEVGYKKPPPAHQFQKGRSGNPRGRPKIVIDVLGSISSALDSSVQTTVGGKVQTLRRREAIAKRLVLKAAAGHMKSIKLVLQALPAPETSVEVYAFDQWGNRLLPEEDYSAGVVEETVQVDERFDNFYPSNRTPNSNSLEWLIQKEVKKRVRILEDGVRKTVLMLDAITKRLVHEAGGGNITAVEMLIKHYPHAHNEIIKIQPQFGSKRLIFPKEK